jgi:hypothetical protein
VLPLRDRQAPTRIIKSSQQMVEVQHLLRQELTEQSTVS